MILIITWTTQTFVVMIWFFKSYKELKKYSSKLRKSLPEDRKYLRHRSAVTVWGLIWRWGYPCCLAQVLSVYCNCWEGHRKASWHAGYPRWLKKKSVISLIFGIMGHLSHIPSGKLPARQTNRMNFMTGFSSIFYFRHDTSPKFQGSNCVHEDKIRESTAHIISVVALFCEKKKEGLAAKHGRSSQSYTVVRLFYSRFLLVMRAEGV